MKKKVLGKLSADLCNKFNIPQFAGKNVVLYADREAYLDKHKDEYMNEESYKNTVNSLSKIIANPFLIYHNKKTNGLELFAKVDENVLVAIRADVSSYELKVRSVYPVNDDKIKNRQSRI